MPEDFTLSPDEDEALDRPERRSRTTRLVGAGFAPTADVPPARRTSPEAPPAYRPCATCGAVVLHGRTRTGEQLALDTTQQSYVVLWDQGADEPWFLASRAYPRHHCPG